MCQRFVQAIFKPFLVLLVVLLAFTVWNTAAKDFAEYISLFTRASTAFISDGKDLKKRLKLIGVPVLIGLLLTAAAIITILTNYRLVFSHNRQVDIGLNQPDREALQRAIGIFISRVVHQQRQIQPDHEHEHIGPLNQHQQPQQIQAEQAKPAEINNSALVGENIEAQDVSANNTDNVLAHDLIQEDIFLDGDAAVDVIDAFLRYIRGGEFFALVAQFMNTADFNKKYRPARD